MYKTIVVHVDGSSQQESRLRAAAMLAREFGAHLIGSAATNISWMDFALLAGSMAAPLVPGEFEGLRKSASERLRAFSDAAARLGVESLETRLIEDFADDGLLLQSRYADLVVLSRDDDAEREGADTIDGSPSPVVPGRMRRLPEHVALRGARPVLVVPPGYAGEAIPGTVVAGWDGSTQALRAFVAALPLLQRAAGVKLAVINPEQLAAQHGEQPGADMALYLARHGVEVEVMLENAESTVGNALMAMARECGAGLMVAGAYGHSRYREWALGGVTRELLARAPVPLLIAH